MPLRIAVSPYHLTTREPPAMASLLLADQVVTLLPAPDAGRTREAVSEAADRLPRYLRLMESWRWTTPLWRAKVLVSGLGGDEAGIDIPQIQQRVREDDSFTPLRPLLEGGGAQTPDESLDALCADILKGGPDPRINIPVAAALDRFCVRHAIFAARAAPSSVTQKVEARLGERLFAVAVPVILQGSGARVLAARAALSGPLGALREAITSAAVAVHEAHRVDRPSSKRLIDAGAEYAGAFDAVRSQFAVGDDEDSSRITAGYVSLTAFGAPADVVLRAGAAAARSVGRGPPRAEPEPVSGAGLSGGTAERLIALVIKPLSCRPDPGNLSGA